MKECEDCEFFGGRDWECGEPICKYKGGYCNCPYTEEGKVKMESTDKNISANIDLGDIETRIIHAIENSLYGIINGEVERIVKDRYEDTIKKMTDNAIKERLEKQIDAYMESTITIGGGWREPERTLTRDEYLSETIAKCLDDKYDVETVRKVITNGVETRVREKTEILKREINGAIKNMFDDATRQTLTDNVVNLLMANDTYRKLSDSMTHLLKE